MENLYAIIAELQEEGIYGSSDTQVLFIGTKEKVEEVYKKIENIKNPLFKIFANLENDTNIQRENLQKLYPNWPTSVEYKEKIQDLIRNYNKTFGELKNQFEYFDYYIYIKENKNIIL